MELYDWILFLHVLSAFSLVAALTVFWTLVLATRPASPVLSQEASGHVVRPVTVASIAGTVGTLLFGVWLAIQSDDYRVWDGWVLASLVLWAVAGGLGDQAGRSFTRAMAGEDEAPGQRRRGLLFHTGASAVVVVILLLMIFKPGA